MTIETRLFINNEYVNSSTNETFAVYNPADDTLITDKVQSASSQDVDNAVAAARAAFEPWKATPSSERSRIMLKYADLIDQNAAKFAALDTKCMGMPLSMATMMAGTQSMSFRYYAGLTDKVHGEVFNEDGDGLLKMIQYEPVGVCAGISAWNGTPLSLGWKIAPAVAAGCTYIHKTSEKSPLSTLLMGELVKEAGFPPGVVNLLSGARETGALLASHMDIDKLSFTGSTAAGRKVQIAAAQSNMKHVTLELGGKSASIVFDDANIENAVLHNSQNFLVSNTQACSAASRLFVHESIAPKFIEALKESWAKFTAATGDPTKPDTFLGPVADKAQRERIDSYLDIAKEEGLELAYGGEKKTGTGQYVSPAIFVNVDVNSRIYREEIFGPVLAVRTFKTEEEAIKMANDTTYGLSGIIFTSNISRGLKVASKINVGTLSINCSHFPNKQTSWGGWKQSGYGREGGLEGLKEYYQTKSIHVNLNA